MQELATKEPSELGELVEKLKVASFITADYIYIL